MAFAKTLVFTLTFITAITINQKLNALNPFSTNSETSRITTCSVKTTIAALVVFLTKTKTTPKTDELIKNIEYSVKTLENCKNSNKQ